MAGCATAPTPASAPTRTEARDTSTPVRPVEVSGADTLYQAAVALVEASLRLHETDRAKEWLSRAPASQRGWEWRYLVSQSDRSAATIPLAGGAVTDLTASPDGNLVAAAMAEGKTHLLDAATGAIVRTLEGHTASAWTPVFAANGDRLATASSDGTARVWNVATGAQLLVMPENGQGVAAASWSPDETRLAVSSWARTTERGVYGTLNVYDPRTGQRLHHLEHGGYPIASLTWSADGARLIGGTWDWNLLVWDARTWGEPRVLAPPESPDYKRIEDFALSPDGSRLAVAHSDGRVRLWDLARLEIVRTLHSPIEGLIRTIADVAYLPGGERVVTVGGDLTVRLWNAETGELIAAHHGHERPILTVAVSPDGRRLYTAGSGGNVRVWDLDALDPARTTWRIPRSPTATGRGAATVYDLAFDPGQRHAVVTTFEGWLRVIDVATGREVRGWRASDEATVGVDWSPDGRWIASTDNDGRAVLWDAESGARVKELLDAGRQLLNVAFSPDGSLIACPGTGASIEIFRMPSGEPMASLSDGEGSVADVVWNADGTLAAAYTDGKVRLWDVRRVTPTSTIDAGTRGAPAIAFDPAGRKLAVVLGRSIRIRDVAAGAWTAEWSPRSGSVRSIAWSPDGRRIAAAVSGNMFEVWDAATGAPLLRLPQTATAWLATWTRRDELVLVPLDETVRMLRARAN
jgi:WD40 repeat protein